MTDTQLNALLAHYDLGDGRYSIGPFSTGGVTLWKQQVRALNLIYALAKRRLIRNRFEQERTKERSREIAVIGGGVAGMTAAVAAADLDNVVWHFEQRPILCHLQAGCDTRWVHPNIYDWPDDRSENPYAALPYLSWQAGTAAQVARSLNEQHKKSQQDRGDAGFRVHLGATTFLDGRTVKWDNSKARPRGGDKRFDIVILATGFGIERGVKRGEVSSYWRNDDLNQLRPGITSEKSDTILVSGTGDGGLIDLLRCKLTGFNQAWIIDDLFPNSSEELITRLRDICREWRELDKPAASGWLYEKYRVLCNDPREPLKDVSSRLVEMVRDDVVVILNGKQRVFSEALSLDTASLLNSFLAFLLYQAGQFNYVPGNCKRDGNSEVVIAFPDHDDDRKSPKETSRYFVDQVIIRHGTDREECLRSLGVPKDSIDTLRSRQQEPQSIESFEPHWKKEGWFAQRAPNGRKEFLPPPSQAIAAAFVGTLSDILEGEFDEKPDFRLTVHRVVRIHDKQFYQQLAPYGGTRDNRDPDRDPGRVFSLDVGLVGYACRHGRPAVLLKGHNWDAIWSALNASKDTHVTTYPDYVCSMFALPILSSPPESNRVSLVVYGDSKNRDLFDRAHNIGRRVLRTISNAAAGFVQQCDDLVKRSIIRFARDSFRGSAVVSTPSDVDAEVAKYDTELQFVEDDIFTPVITQNYLHWDCMTGTTASSLHP